MIRTDRLVLRQWRDEDHEPFAALNGDPAVMEFFPSAHDRATSAALVGRNRDHIAKHGWGLWAVELAGSAQFIGFIGIVPVPFKAHFTPAVEVGWRLAAAHWNQGYATEGASAALDFGFKDLGLDQIVSMTAAGNLRSRRVMEKLGMTRDPADDFDHPQIPEGHPIRAHVLYRIARPSTVAPN